MYIYVHVIQLSIIVLIQRFEYPFHTIEKISLPWSPTPSTSWMISPTFNSPLWYAAPSGWMEMILGRGCCVFTPPSMTRPRKGKHFWISMTWTDRLGINSPGWCCEALNQTKKIMKKNVAMKNETVYSIFFVRWLTCWV